MFVGCGLQGIFHYNSSWHEKPMRMRMAAFTSIPWLKYKQFQLRASEQLAIPHHVLDLCLADSQSQCVINLLLSPGLSHNHK